MIYLMYLPTYVLRNTFNIREFEELVKQEYQLIRTKALDLYVFPILVNSMKDVCKIHFMLFQI
ncbi:hypothetical protein DYD39_14780 [Listeria monocytogenes]|nr:hypothetical protein [Listeria monocytogenes]